MKGERFDSKAEFRVISEARLLAMAGDISELRTKPVYNITINGVTVCRYEADFQFKDANGSLWVCDVKSHATARNPVYRLKKKLMKAVHNIDIKEIYNGRKQGYFNWLFKPTDSAQ